MDEGGCRAVAHQHNTTPLPFGKVKAERLPLGYKRGTIHMAWQRSAPVDKPVMRSTTRNRGCSAEWLTKSVDTPEQLSSCVLLQSVRGANPLQVANTIESLLHSKAERGSRKGLQITFRQRASKIVVESR